MSTSFPGSFPWFGGGKRPWDRGWPYVLIFPMVDLVFDWFQVRHAMLLDHSTFFCRSVEWWFWRVYTEESRLFTKHHFILFFLSFQKLNNASVMCRPLARFPLVSAKQRNLRDAKSISLHRTNLLYGDVLWLSWFFSWRKLDSSSTMLPYIIWNHPLHLTHSKLMLTPSRAK